MRTLILFLGIFASFSSFAQKLTQVQSFTPVGTVATAQQVHIQFSEFMFALGKTDQPAPVSSGCDQYGTGRWLNPKEWVFDFERALPPMIHCEYSFKAGLKSEKGFPVVNPATPYFFELMPAQIAQTVPYGTTDRAQIMKSDARSGNIDPDQVFVVVFTGKIPNEEIQKRLSFEVQGRTEPVGFTILGQDVVKKLRKQAREYFDINKDRTVVALKPKLEFPNTEFALVTLKDVGGNVSYYFRTKPYFRAEFSCSRDNAQAPCSPIQRASLSFNSLVSTQDLKKIKAVPVHGKGAEVLAEYAEDQSHSESVLLKGPFKAGETYRIEIPSGLKDIQGRSLSNQKKFPLEVKFDSLPAVAKFPGSFGVIESANPILPLSVRNIETELKVSESNLSDLKVSEHAPEIIRWLKRVNRQNQRVYEPGSEYDIRKKDADAKAADYGSVLGIYSKDLGEKIQHSALPTAHEMNQAEVIGIPLKGNGLHVVELESKVLGKRVLDRATPLYTSTAVLMTNLGVHFKWGQNGPSLVWVTELSSGKPVEGAQVSIESCVGKVLGSGKTGSDGTLTIAQIGKKRGSDDFKNCGYETSDNISLVVMAKKGDDFSFTLNTFNRGLESWRFNLPYASGSNTAAHTVLARDLLKPGQKVQMKHYFREFHWQGFTVPTKKPTNLFIVHNGSDEEWSIPVKFDGQGIAVSEWKLPETAKLGHYSLSLGFDSKKKTGRISVGGFEVQDFRLPVMNVILRAPDVVTQDTKDPKISVQGTYLSGGPASSLPVELRFLREKTPAHSRYVGDYYYSLDLPVKEGISERKNDYEDESYGDSDETPAPKKERETLENTKFVKKINLDAGGSAYLDIPAELLNTNEDGDVRVSMSYNDPNGEIQSAIRGLSVFSRDRYLGLNKDSRGYINLESSGTKLDLRVADVNGKGSEGVPVKVNLYRSTNYTHRAKLVGGFYGYQTTTEIKKVGTFCEAKSDAKGNVPCVGMITTPGNYIAEATAQDSKGKSIILVHEFTVYGEGSDSEEYSESDRLTLVPSKSEYNDGEDAVVAVRSSFKDSTALVTLERGGVMEHFVTQISGEHPEVKVPMKMQYSPNLMLSVLAVRGRIDNPAPTGLVDLAKPAFKLGLVELNVGIKSHELPLSVQTDQKVYQVRSKVKVSITTKPGAEVALAVVDQALLKLKHNDTFDLLSQMMITQGHSVETSTLQMNLIGKRHFGKKATPFGGGGGKMMTRELLDSLVSWKPRLVANQDGKIETDFNLNDSISGFAVVAVGSSGMNFYGTAKTEIAATQDLQIISSVPLSVRENDELPLQFLLRNTTLKPFHVKASLKVGSTDLTPVEIELPAQSTQEVKWVSKIPYGIKTLPLLISAVAQEGPKDQLKISSAVTEVSPVRVREGFLTQLSKEPSELPMSFPEHALLDKGGYRVQLQARLSEVPNSVLTYLSAYPFSCLEQQSSKAIGLDDFAEWNKVQTKFKTYLDSNSLLKFFPDSQYGSLDLSAYLFSISSTAAKLDKRYEMPKNSAMTKRLLTALVSGMEGRILVSQTWWPEWVKNNERIAAAEAVSAFEPITQATYEGLKSVRDKQDLNHSLSLLKILDQSQASLKSSLADRDLYLNEILSHYAFENTHMKLKDASFRFFGGLSASPDGLRARTLIALMEHDRKDDATKLLRSLIEEMKTGSFDTTPGDAWGTVALRLFKQKYENAQVLGQVNLSVSSIKKSVKISEKAPKAEAFIPVKEALTGGKTSTQLTETYTGTGAPWSFTLVEAAIPITSALDHGYSVSKTIKPLQTAKTGEYSRGDIYEVSLEITAKTHQTWIAVTDPIPTGASILSTESSAGWIAFEERRMDRMQVFFEYLPTGKTTFTYKVRLNQQGAFEFPSSRVEAMYDPTQYGETPNTKMKVNP